MKSRMFAATTMFAFALTAVSLAFVGCGPDTPAPGADSSGANSAGAGPTTAGNPPGKEATPTTPSGP